MYFNKFAQYFGLKDKPYVWWSAYISTGYQNMHNLQCIQSMKNGHFLNNWYITTPKNKGNVKPKIK